MGTPNRGLMYDEFLKAQDEIVDVWNRFQDKIVLPVDLVYNNEEIRTGNLIPKD